MPKVPVVTHVTSDSRWTGNCLVTPVTRTEHDGWALVVREVSQRTWQPSRAPHPESQVSRTQSFLPAFPPPFLGQGWGLSARVKVRSGLDNQHDPVWPGPLWALGSVERRLGFRQGQWPHATPASVVSPPQGATCGLSPSQQSLLSAATIQGPQNSHSPNYSPTTTVPLAPSLWVTPHLGKP